MLHGRGDFYGFIASDMALKVLVYEGLLTAFQKLFHTCIFLQEKYVIGKKLIVGRGKVFNCVKLCNL